MVYVRTRFLQIRKVRGKCYALSLPCPALQTPKCPNPNKIHYIISHHHFLIKYSNLSIAGDVENLLRRTKLAGVPVDDLLDRNSCWAIARGTSEGTSSYIVIIFDSRDAEGSGLGRDAVPGDCGMLAWLQILGGSSRHTWEFFTERNPEGVLIIGIVILCPNEGHFDALIGTVTAELLRWSSCHEAERGCESEKAGGEGLHGDDC